MKSGAENIIMNEEQYLIRLGYYYNHYYYNNNSADSQCAIMHHFVDYLNFLDDNHPNSIETRELLQCIQREQREYSDYCEANRQAYQCLSQNILTYNGLSLYDRRFIEVFDNEDFIYPFESFAFICQNRERFSNIQQQALPFFFRFLKQDVEIPEEYNLDQCNSSRFPVESIETEHVQWNQFNFCSNENEWNRHILEIDTYSVPIVFHQLSSSAISLYQSERVLSNYFYRLQMAIGQRNIDQILRSEQNGSRLTFYIVDESEQEDEALIACFNRRDIRRQGTYDINNNRILITDLHFQIIVHELGHAMDYMLLANTDARRNLQDLYYSIRNNPNYLPISVADRGYLGHPSNGELYALDHFDEFIAILFENLVYHRTGYAQNNNFINNPQRLALLKIMEQLFPLNGEFHPEVLTRNNIQEAYQEQGIDFTFLDEYVLETEISYALDIHNPDTILINTFFGFTWPRDNCSIGIGLYTGIQYDQTPAVNISAAFYARFYLSPFFSINLSTNTGVIFDENYIESTLDIGAQIQANIPINIHQLALSIGFNQDLSFWNQHNPSQITFAIAWHQHFFR